MRKCGRDQITRWTESTAAWRGLHVTLISDSFM
jgi:hypothetical protein